MHGMTTYLDCTEAEYTDGPAYLISQVVTDSIARPYGRAPCRGLGPVTNLPGGDFAELLQGLAQLRVHLQIMHPSPELSYTTGPLCGTLQQDCM